MCKSKTKLLTIAIIVVVALFVITSAFHVVLPAGYTNLFPQTTTESSIHISGNFWVAVFIGVTQIIFLFVKKGGLKVLSLLSSLAGFSFSLLAVPLYIAVMGITDEIYHIQAEMSFGGDYVATPFGYAFIALAVVNVILQSTWCVITSKSKAPQEALDNIQ